MHEFDLIKTYFQRGFSLQHSDVVLGSGDDCALLQPPKNQCLAVSIDTLIESVHFPKNFDPYEIGYKSLVVNLSDLAAMGAVPAWFTCALSLTAAQKKAAWLTKFSEGLKAASREYHIDLVGGDLTKSKILSITIQVHGFVPKKYALQRNQAKPGDHIYVSGELGKAFLSNYTARPKARLQLALALRGKSTCAIDISDGLIADLSHILKASRVGASLYLDKIPLLHPKGLYAGDDYELCFTAPSNLILKNIDCEYHSIGIIEKKPGLRIFLSENNKKLYTTKQSGYRHF